MKEERVEFSFDNLFYNPKMHFNRSISSLAVGSINEDLYLVDGFCSSGVRGIRYKKENKNVKKLFLIDANRRAEKVIKENLLKNSIDGKILIGDFNKEIVGLNVNFIEVDPFGSPIPFITQALYTLSKQKKSYLSVTATDVAVLCGKNVKASIKKYNSKNLDNDFTHEVGVRILIKSIVERASPYDLALKPLISLSKEHYIKVVFEVERSAQKAYNMYKNLGFVNFCWNCGYFNTSKFPELKCPICNKKMDYAGKLWLGNIENKIFIEKMINLNNKRNYEHKREIDELLNLLLNENTLFYYNLHKLAKRHSIQIPKMKFVLSCLREKGYLANRTHFNRFSIKTNASLKEILACISGPRGI